MGGSTAAQEASKLQSTTAERVQHHKVITCVGSSTEPTELKLAVVAGHMIAALGLLNTSSTHLAEPDILILGPILKLFIESTVTGRE